MSESFEELDEMIAEGEEYENKEVKDLIMDAEIVFLDEHICNDNLKVRDKEEFLMEPEKVMKDNEKNKVSVTEMMVVSYLWVIRVEI